MQYVLLALLDIKPSDRLLSRSTELDQPQFGSHTQISHTMKDEVEQIVEYEDDRRISWNAESATEHATFVTPINRERTYNA